MSKAAENLEIRQIRKLRTLLAQNEASLFKIRSTVPQPEKKSGQQTTGCSLPPILSS